MKYNEGDWLFQKGRVRLISKRVRVKDIEDLLRIADEDNEWVDNVRNAVLQRDRR